MSLNLAPSCTVAPAKAGAYRVSPLKPTGEMGTSLRWCGAVLDFEVAL
jgi:hypothetical protein